MRGWQRWRPQPGALENARTGGASRDQAYEAELTHEGRAAFADRGYLADPASARSDPAVLRGRTELAGDLARHLSPEAAGHLWRAAYSGQPGVTEYRVPDREAGV